MKGRPLDEWHAKFFEDPKELNDFLRNDNNTATGSHLKHIWSVWDTIDNELINTYPVVLEFPEFTFELAAHRDGMKVFVDGIDLSRSPEPLYWDENGQEIVRELYWVKDHPIFTADFRGAIVKDVCILGDKYGLLGLRFNFYIEEDNIKTIVFFNKGDELGFQLSKLDPKYVASELCL
jgi:hypothetical protein